MYDQLDRMMAGASAALDATFRERALYSASPWFAYVCPVGGIIVDRTDNPEAPIPADWRVICRVRGDCTNAQNAYAIREALFRMPLPAGGAS